MQKDIIINRKKIEIFIRLHARMIYAEEKFSHDMDGVLISGKSLIPGADTFIENLKNKGIKFLVLTNNSIYTQVDLAHRLRTIGLDIDAEQIFTSAMATAAFMKSQKEKGSAFVIGETGLTVAIHNADTSLQLRNPTSWCWRNL